MINSYIITIEGNKLSEEGAKICKKSAPNNVRPHIFQAVTPDQVDDFMKKHLLEWNYPWQGEELDFKSGLKKSAYPTNNPKKRIACFLSHYILWKKCASGTKPMVIQEHDSVWKPRIFFNEALLNMSLFNIIGLNDPRGATRKPDVYHTEVQVQEGDIVAAPKIDSYEIPQGIAGNSSYYMKPSGAKRMIQLVDEYGAWPNDAIMCRQLVQTLGQTKNYYTQVQGLQSTTTL